MKAETRLTRSGHEQVPNELQRLVDPTLGGEAELRVRRREILDLFEQPTGLMQRRERGLFVPACGLQSRGNVSGRNGAGLRRTRLEVRLDDIEDEIPMRSTELLYNWREVEKELGNERVDLLVEIVVAAYPRLHSLDEEHRPLLREEDDGRVEGWCGRQEKPE